VNWKQAYRREKEYDRIVVEQEKRAGEASKLADLEVDLT